MALQARPVFAGAICLAIAAAFMPRPVNAQANAEPTPEDHETTVAPKSSPEANDDSTGAVATTIPDTASWARDRVDMWTGVEAFWNVWSIYSGGTFAPFGSLTANGFRLRATASLASYRYIARWFDPALNAAAPLAVQGRSTSLDMLAGYHWRIGSVTTRLPPSMRLSALASRVTFCVVAPSLA